MMFEKIKQCYTDGLWKISRVWDAVQKGVITEAEYMEITGSEYPEEKPESA